MDRLVKLIGRLQRKSGDIWLQNISESGTWLSAQILKSQESFQQEGRKSQIFFPLLVNLSTAYIWLRKFHVIHPLCLAQAVLFYKDKCLKTYTWYRSSLVQISLECVPDVYFYHSWPQPRRVNFHFSCIIQQKIELSVLRQMWKTLQKSFRIWSFIRSVKKASRRSTGVTQLWATFTIALPAATYLTFSGFCYLMTLWERSFTGSLTITFLKVSHLEERKRGWQRTAPPSPPPAVSKHDALWSSQHWWNSRPLFSSKRNMANTCVFK